MNGAPWWREAWRELWPLFALWFGIVFVLASAAGYVVHKLLTLVQQGCVCV